MVVFKCFSATAQYHISIDTEVSKMFFRRIGDLRQDHDMYIVVTKKESVKFLYPMQLSWPNIMMYP